MTAVARHPGAAPRNSAAERRVLVAGPGNWTDTALIHQGLDAALALLQVPLIEQDRVTLIHGEKTSGLDVLAAQAAAVRGWSLDGWPARWNQFATPCRGWHLTPTTMGACTSPAHRSYEELSALHADLVMAFPLDKEGSGRSAGTWSCVRAAVGASLPVLVLWKERLYPCGPQAAGLLPAPAKLHKLLPVAF